MLRVGTGGERIPTTRIVGTAALAAAFAAAFGGAGGSLGWPWGEALLCALASAGFLSLARETVLPSAPLYAGTCATLAAGSPRRIWLLRAGVLVLAPLGGAGVALYALASLRLSLRDPGRPGPRVDWRMRVAAGMLGLALVLAASPGGLVVGATDEVFSVLLIGSGLPLFWSSVSSRGQLRVNAEAADGAFGTALGLLLALGGAGLVLSSTGLFGEAKGTIAGTAVALAVLALVVGPRWLRTTRLLITERAARALAQERAEIGEHLHDGVLQTLALIQRRATDPAEVASLARRQERELRSWLHAGAMPPGPAATLGGALAAAAADVEDAERVPIELVTVGDAALDERLGAVAAAAREAMLNAVRHGLPPISVYCRVTPDAVTVTVHDRGAGFDPEEVPEDRRGVRESILARMHRNGGSARVQTAAGAGCEVVLEIRR